MHKTIVSSQNSYIKWVRSLQTKKGRTKECKFVIEGEKILQEALQSTVSIDSVLIEESATQYYEALMGQLEEKNVPLFPVSYSVMKSITETQTPQGIAAVISFIRNDEKLLNMDFMKDDFLIAIDRIQDPGNLGTIIRTADAAGATGMLLSEGTVDLYNPKVIRSTMGSIFHIPVLQNCDFIHYLKSAKMRGYYIVASHLKGEDKMYVADFINRPVILIIGNEAQGIQVEAAEMADLLYKIPMLGRAESLNASVAAGIMIYDIVRHKMSF